MRVRSGTLPGELSNPRPLPTPRVLLVPGYVLPYYGTCTSRMYSAYGIQCYYGKRGNSDSIDRAAMWCCTGIPTDSDCPQSQLARKFSQWHRTTTLLGPPLNSVSIQGKSLATSQLYEEHMCFSADSPVRWTGMRYACAILVGSTCTALGVHTFRVKQNNLH